jgi:benzoate/toluate 1,2-dioxygenase beta subunit
MSHDLSRWHSVERLLGREALTLDSRDWDGWLALYDPQAEYWVPAWDDDGEPTRDPQAEISLIYYPNRGGLEDRVYRIRTGRSAATMPLRRTCHMFTLLDVAENDDGLDVHTSWNVHSFGESDVLLYFGHAHYHLIASGDSWVITRKKTLVMNDIAQTMLDVYTI